jgi:hypothetical protein
MIIDLFYIWGEKWRDSYMSNDDGEGNTCWGIMLVVTSLILYAGTGYFMIRNFEWFAGDNCGSHKTYLIASSALIVVATILTLSTSAENKSVITSGAVSVYITYLTWSGLTSSL